MSIIVDSSHTVEVLNQPKDLNPLQEKVKHAAISGFMGLGGATLTGLGFILLASSIVPLVLSIFFFATGEPLPGSVMVLSMIALVLLGVLCIYKGMDVLSSANEERKKIAQVDKNYNTKQATQQLIYKSQEI